VGLGNNVGGPDTFFAWAWLDAFESQSPNPSSTCLHSPRSTILSHVLGLPKLRIRCPKYSLLLWKTT
jgi:hypothetical protein